MVQQNLTLHFIGSMTIATLLWVVPPPLKAPRSVTTFALIGSVAGYAYSFAISKQVSREWKQERRFDLKEEKIANYTMALTEKAERRELEQLFSPVSSAVSGAVSQISQSVSQFSETISEGRETAVSERGPAVSETSETTKWTAFDLTQTDAQKLVQQAIADGLTQTQILETFWEVRPGSSKAYKQALEQYRQLMAATV